MAPSLTRLSNAIVSQVALSICPVVGAAGAAALHIYPRYILHNGLDKPLLWRQASAHPSRVCSLPPGASTALTWDDSGEPRRVMVRVHEPSWDWSRGFDVDSPGDTFIKLRQQVRGETLLVRAATQLRAPCISDFDESESRSSISNKMSTVYCT